MKEQHSIKEEKWTSGEEAMRKLRISSETTLQKLRDEEKIWFSQPEKKIIRCDNNCLQPYLEQPARDTF